MTDNVVKRPRTLGSTQNRERAFHSAKDYEMTASQLGEIEPTEVDAKRKASMVVAAHVPKGEIVDVLMMLGIHPSQPDWTDGPVTGVPRQFGSTDPKGA